jgi:hypothetical protein
MQYSGSRLQLLQALGGWHRGYRGETGAFVCKSAGLASLVTAVPICPKGANLGLPHSLRVGHRGDLAMLGGVVCKFTVLVISDASVPVRPEGTDQRLLQAAGDVCVVELAFVRMFAALIGLTRPPRTDDDALRACRLGGGSKNYSRSI